MQPDGPRKRSYPWGDRCASPCFSDACLKGARQTGCVLGDKSHWGCVEPSFFSSRCALPVAALNQCFLKQVVQYFFMVPSCFFTKLDMDASCNSWSVNVNGRPGGLTILLETPQKKTSLLFLFFFIMLVFKDQKREAVICMPKKFQKFTISTVALLMLTWKCVGLGL